MGSYNAKPGVDWGSVISMMAMDDKLNTSEAERKAEAIRWQGAQDYQTLINSGVPAREALQRSSAKLFYNDPKALSTSVSSYETDLAKERMAALREQVAKDNEINRERIMAWREESSRSKDLATAAEQARKASELESSQQNAATRLMLAEGQLEMKGRDLARRELDQSQTITIETKDPNGNKVLRKYTPKEYENRINEVKAAPLISEYEVLKGKETATPGGKTFFGRTPYVETMNSLSNNIVNKLGVDLATGKAINSPQPTPVPAGTGFPNISTSGKTLVKQVQADGRVALFHPDTGAFVGWAP